MSQITKLGGLAAVSILILSLSACNDQKPESSLKSATTETEKHESALCEEIQKLLREEKHDPKILKEALRGKTWVEVKPIWEAEQKRYEKLHGKSPSKGAILFSGLEIRDVFSDFSIENSERRSKKALEELERGLQGMAEKEGIAK